MYLADDLAVAKRRDLYFLYRDPKMIAPLRTRLEAILPRRRSQSLDFHQPYDQVLTVSWCRSLFWPRPCGCGSSPPLAKSAISICGEELVAYDD